MVPRADDPLGDIDLADRPGLEVSQIYFTDVVRPLLAARVPDVRYAAARIGPGSDVLGLDDATSRDHDWGLRLQLFLNPEDVGVVREILATCLPERVGGLPVRFAFTSSNRAEHHVETLTINELIQHGIGFDPRAGVGTLDWLSLSGQAALEIVSGRVFTDSAATSGPARELADLQDCLTWYPDDVWRYLVASEWQGISEDLPLMSRTGHRGDDLGSRVLAGRITDAAVRLTFLLHRAWLPYPKWRGTLLTRLPDGENLRDMLESALSQDFWRSRQEAIEQVLNALHVIQDDLLGVTANPLVVPFFNRPYLQINPGLVAALAATINDPYLTAMPAGMGGIERLTDNPVVLTDPTRRRALLTSLVGDLRVASVTDAP